MVGGGGGCAGCCIIMFIMFITMFMSMVKQASERTELDRIEVVQHVRACANADVCILGCQSWCANPCVSEKPLFGALISYRTRLEGQFQSKDDCASQRAKRNGQQVTHTMTHNVQHTSTWKANSNPRTTAQCNVRNETGNDTYNHK